MDIRQAPSDEPFDGDSADTPEHGALLCASTAYAALVAAIWLAIAAAALGFGVFHDANHGTLFRRQPAIVRAAAKRQGPQCQELVGVFSAVAQQAAEGARRGSADGPRTARDCGRSDA